MLLYVFPTERKKDRIPLEEKGRGAMRKALAKTSSFCRISNPITPTIESAKRVKEAILLLLCSSMQYELYVRHDTN